MKLFGKFLITALVLAMILPFTVLKGKDGRPLMSFSDLKMPKLSLPELPETPDLSNIKDKTPNISMPGKDIVYKWRDKEGELHFTSTPPPKGIEYTVKGYDPNTNLIQSVEIKTEESEHTAQTEDKNTKEPLDLSNPYSPEKVKKLIDDAQNVQKLLNDRLKKQEALID